MTAELIVASSLWGYSHFLAHFGIGAGYLVAVTRNNTILNGLMRIRLTTKLAGAGFFLFCGVTHFGLALGISDSPVVTVTDHLQLICIYGFLGGLLLDGRRAVRRLSNAFLAIREEFDGLAIVRGEEGQAMIASGEAEELDVGSHVIATMNFAMHGQGHEPPGPGPRE